MKLKLKVQKVNQINPANKKKGFAEHNVQSCRGGGMRKAVRTGCCGRTEEGHDR